MAKVELPSVLEDNVLGDDVLSGMMSSGMMSSGMMSSGMMFCNCSHSVNKSFHVTSLALSTMRNASAILIFTHLNKQYNDQGITVFGRW